MPMAAQTQADAASEWIWHQLMAFWMCPLALWADWWSLLDEGLYVAQHRPPHGGQAAQLEQPVHVEDEEGLIA